MRMKYLSPVNMIRTKRTQSLSLEEHLQNTMDRCLRSYRHKLALYAEQMKGLSPLDKLNQGYAYVADSHGKTLTCAAQAAVGDHVVIYVKDGRLNAQITEKLPVPDMIVNEGRREQPAAEDRKEQHTI